MRELPTRVRSSVVTRAIVTNGEVAAHRIARDATKRRPVVITRMRRILPQDALAVIKAPRASPSLFPGAPAPRIRAYRHRGEPCRTRADVRAHSGRGAIA